MRGMGRHSSAAKLRTWMDVHGVSQREGGPMFEVHYSYINALLSGRRRPGLAVAIRIEKLTGVPANGWLSPHEAIEATDRRVKLLNLSRLRRTRAATKAKRAAAEMTTDESADSQVAP